MEKTPTIVVIEPIHADGIEILEKCGKVIQLSPSSRLKDLLRVSEKADAFVTRGTLKISREVLETARRLKVIGVHGVGIDHIDVEFAERKGVKIVRTLTALTDTVAEFTIGLMLSLLRKLPMADLAVRKGEWNRKYSDLIGIEMMGKTVGLIGLGRIGGAVAKRLRAFDVNLIYHKERRKIELEKQLDIKYVSFQELLSVSDIISMHVPLTPKTLHLISRREFNLMKPGVFIVNTSRGAVIDEKGLCDALASGKVAGAALDVFESEPVNLNSPLLKFNNVILTPHLAAGSKEALRRLSVNVADNVVACLLQRK